MESRDVTLSFGFWLRIDFFLRRASSLQPFEDKSH